MDSNFNIKEKLDSNQTVLLLVPSTDYNNLIVEATKQLSGKNIVYVTLNKTSESLKEAFSKKKINSKNVFYIDAISKTVKKTVNTKDCVFCSSPGALTEISIAITKFLKHNIDYIIFDSITSLLIYEKKSPVSKFLSSVINNIKNSKTKAVFIALSVKEQKDLIKETGMFVDEVIDLGEIGK
jgi:KaiC/GvpD/RAD55 family RecA-like ATPase